MNSSGSSSPDTADGAVSGGMKTFFLLVIVFLAFLLFASIRYANVDLTPDTPTSSQGASISEPEVVNIQEESPTYSNQGGFLLPVTGACSNPYIVQDGDYLSRVAEICDTSIAAIRAANPEISNANLIYPGQQILIPVGGAVLQAPVPVTGSDNPIIRNEKDTSSEAPGAVSPEITLSVPVIPQTSSGTPLQVKALNFPSNTPVNIGIGSESGGYNIVAAGITDMNGILISTIPAPASADSTDQWVVVVATNTQPMVQARSQPFTLGQK